VKTSYKSVLKDKFGITKKHENIVCVCEHFGILAFTNCL